MGAFDNLTGRQFGRLIVINRAPNRGTATMWNCECSCCEHNIVQVSSSDLKNGKVRSCGCLKRELIRERCGCKLEGRQFGRLKVIRQIGRDIHNNLTWECKCDCGNPRTVITTSTSLLKGHTQSCGCYKRDRTSEIKTKYTDPLVKHLAINVLGRMKNRCYCKSSVDYPKWGGRGITICDEWLNDPEAFAKWSLSNGYSSGLSIDRIDNNGPYAPWNCRWVTNDVQCNNKRTSRVITVNGVSQTVAQWSAETGIRPDYLYTKTDEEIENILYSKFRDDPNMIMPEPPYPSGTG